MVIKNKSKKTVLADKISLQTLFNKSLGLIGKNTPEAIIFHTRFGIHTFLLKFPIDILVLNKNGEVKALKTDMKPNRLFFWNMQFDTVIELPAGTIKKSKTKKNDLIEIIF
jgi:uncharacterized protein